DIIVRLAHSVLLVPQPTRPLNTRIDIENYARRYLAPLTRYIASGAPQSARPATAEPTFPATAEAGAPTGAHSGSPEIQAVKTRRSRVELLIPAGLAGLVGAGAAVVFFMNPSPPTV